jgi:prolyl oligopeptidase
MRKIFLFTLILIANNIFSQEIEFPFARKIPVIDTFFNAYIVEDGFRWMEDINNEEVKTWINEQNKISKKQLQKAINKNQAFKNIDKYSYTKYSRPVKKGKYYFSYAYYDVVGLPALFYKTNLNQPGEILVDPNFISKQDQITLKAYSVSKDSKYLAYQFGRNGSDWAEVKVINLKTGIHLKDHLTDIKFSNIEWLGNGFFYSKYPKADKFSPTLGEKIYYHEIGKHQDEDKLIFKRNNPKIDFQFTVSSNERFFILKEDYEDLGKRNIFYIDYKSDNPTLKPLLMNLKDDFNILESRNGKLIASTNLNSNTGFIVEIDPLNPFNIKEIIPPYEKSVLIETKILQEKIIAIYQKNQRPIITVYDFDGNLLYSLEMPIATSIGGFNGNIDDTELLFYFTSYTLPPVVYKFNIQTFERKLLQHTSVTFDFEDIVYKEVEYLSSDSTVIPMFLIYHKDLELNGDNPTLLKTYGGFGSIVQPHYEPGIIYFIKNGGVLAYTKIRGSGVFGHEWHNQGRRENKQNSFNDFNSAAEYLIKNNYTNSDKLAITGGSNGGLIVAASAIQRPELYKLVVPVVGVFDMLRFEKFTVGNLHIDEFGTVSDSTDFVNLISYSPLHNIKENINYPGMLIITSENDERVPPFHSYKFVAKLQNRDAQKNPILLKVIKNAGHSGSIGIFKDVKETSEFYGYIYKYLTEHN